MLYAISAYERSLKNALVTDSRGHLVSSLRLSFIIIDKSNFDIKFFVSIPFVLWRLKKLFSLDHNNILLYFY